MIKVEKNITVKEYIQRMGKLKVEEKDFLFRSNGVNEIKGRFITKKNHMRML